ncbi:MAG: glycosyltransferase family 2 protein [Bacteroidia bacterium]|nr:glycosyltransferase family 2 protein [Bacteroidia bacterium]
MKQFPLVSIIIPVYNAEKTLPYCLESIFKQTYRSVELLFIDDCCTDNSIEIINEYIGKRNKTVDFSIKIIRHEHNKGVAAARNTGLSHATGEFIYYVDSDDIVSENALELLISEATNNQADIVGCEWYLSYRQNSRYMKQPSVDNGDDAFKKMTGGLLRWNLWLFLVRRSLYENNQIRFIEGMNMGEDMMVMGKLFLCAEKVVMLHRPLYSYIQTNSGSLTKDNSENHMKQVSANVLELEQFVISTRGESYKKYIEFLKLNIKLPLLLSNDNLLHKRWQKWFPDSNNFILQNNMLPVRTRVLQWLAFKNQFWIVKLYYTFVFRFVYGVIYK